MSIRGSRVDTAMCSPPSGRLSHLRGRPPALGPPAGPAAAPAAKPAAGGEKPGRHLIGKLEGPTIVTDAAQIPKAFNEAPTLADLVKQGKLPPVEQRLPAEPLVIKPLREIGKYG